MGDWTILIEGTGCHDNGGKEYDADVIARDTVEKLREKGHTIQRSSFTSGNRKDIIP